VQSVSSAHIYSLASGGLKTQTGGVLQQQLSGIKNGMFGILLLGVFIF
jgi:hypothetical protein